MVVLHQQHIRVARQHALKGRHPLGVHRCAHRVLRARDDHGGADSLLERGLERLRDEAQLVNRNRDRNQSERAEDVTDREVSRVVDQHPIAGTEVRLEDPLERVERA